MPVERLAQGAEAARGVEGLVAGAVEGEFLELLHRRDLAQLPVDDRLAALDVLVDDPVRAPGQVVGERVGGILRQRADAQANGVELVEAARDVVRRDGDEAGREAALRNEGRRGAFGQFLDHAGGRHVLGEVEVVHAGQPGGLRHMAGQVKAAPR